MSGHQPQFCAICAWRETCAKKFCVTDGGARCPDFSRDIAIRDQESGAEASDRGSVRDKR